MKKVKPSYKNIFTPQGELGNVQKNPNLDFLMNIFNIPRVFSVSGFGNWSVGRHSLCAAFIALYWAKFQKYSSEKRDRLVTLAITHDLHEAVTGDILPFFKTEDVLAMIRTIQNDLLQNFAITAGEKDTKELKLIDMISFLYEIRASHPKPYQKEKVKLLKRIEKRQRSDIFLYASKTGFRKDDVENFLKMIKL